MTTLLLAVALLGCRARVAGPIEPALPIVDMAQPAYAGMWIGPELSLHFVGPWVIVRPTADPEAAPIELRVTVEREQGDAHALRTSLAGVWPASFLRPSDWTLLVEDGQLAIAMGDEPLTAYVRADEPPVLRGPVMLDELLADPEAGLDEPGMADGVACLELANDRCVELEAGGPLVAGCRELEWTLCATTLGPLPADPIERAAELSARRIHARTLELRFAEALVSAAAAREAAEALRERVRSSARATLDDIARDGPLPSDDPHLPELLARLGQGSG